MSIHKVDGNTGVKVLVNYEGRTIDRATCHEVPVVGDNVVVLDDHGLRQVYKVVSREHRLGQYVDLYVEKVRNRANGVSGLGE